MLLDDHLDKAITELFRQWNIAEGRIKQAEQARANQVVAAAIFELRYAGRKVMDAMQLLLTKDWRSDQAVYDKIAAYIADATEDCVKAKHDAIDAVLDFVTAWFAAVEDALGLHAVQTYFPDYLEETGSISEIQEKIAESRKNRTESRDAIYDEIDKDGKYDAILKLYKRMLDSSERVLATITHEKRRESWIFGLHVTAVVLGVLALADIIYRLFFS